MSSYHNTPMGWYLRDNYMRVVGEENMKDFLRKLSVRNDVHGGVFLSETYCPPFGFRPDTVVGVDTFQFDRSLSPINPDTKSGMNRMFGGEVDSTFRLEEDGDLELLSKTYLKSDAAPHLLRHYIFVVSDEKMSFDFYHTPSMFHRWPSKDVMLVIKKKL